MTDDEVICTWMEPRPKTQTGMIYRFYGNSSGIVDSLSTREGWWVCDEVILDGEPTTIISPRPLDLDALHEVEARLTDEQWWNYSNNFNMPCDFRALIHLSAAQKIKSLAAVLRPLVEKI